MDVRQFAFLARQPSAALKNRSTFLGLPKRGLALVLANAMFWQPLLAQADGIVVSAPGTSLGQAANGVPIVNIAAPNASGLSHNQFKDYNVGANGLILNNATNRTESTQLGGIILGNSNLNGRAASTILNEVNGGSPSQLRGYTEVAGQSAHVIVANPYGITCNGCGFINTPQATLTTGKAVIENGQVGRYQVDQGSVSIEGAGLNANNIDRFEIITRSAKLNAEIQAKNLTIIAGANDVDAKTLKTTARTADPATAPQLAIDSSALGGMYAGAIKLVSSEAGVGVKLDGKMLASGGDMQLDANGHLSLMETSASGAVNVKAASLEAKGPVYAGTTLDVKTQGDLTSQNNLVAQDRITLAAGGQLTNNGIIEAGVNPDNTRNTNADISISAQSLNNAGKHIIASRDLDITATQTLNNQGGTLNGQRQTTVKAGTLDNQNKGRVFSAAQLKLAADTVLNGQGGLINSVGPLTATIGHLNNTDGEVSSKGDTTLTLGTMDNLTGVVMAENALTVTATGALNNQSGLISGWQGLTVNGSSLDNRNNGTVSSRQGDVSLTLSGALLNSHAGAVVSQKALTVQADSLDNSDQGVLSSAAGQRLTVNGLLSNTLDGSITSGAELTLQAMALNNSGMVNAADGLTFTGTDFDNSHGTFSGKSGVTLDLLGTLTNTSGKLSSVGPLRVQRSAQINNQNGEINSQGLLSLLTGGLDNSQKGTIGADDMLLVNASGALDNSVGGLIGSRAGDLRIDAARLSNGKGSLQGKRAVNLTVTGDIDNQSGTVIAQDGDLTVKAADLDNRGGTLSSVKGALETHLAGVLKNGYDLSNNSQGGTLQAQRLMLNALAGINNNGGRIAALAGDAVLDVGPLGNIDNRNGGIAAGNLLQVTGNHLDNSGDQGGKISGNQISFDLQGKLNNRKGIIESGSTLSTAAASLDNQNGQLRALGKSSKTVFAIGGLLDNSNGTLETANTDLGLNAGSFQNQGGNVLHVGTGIFGISMANLNDVGGQLVTHGNLTLDGDSWTNSSSLQANHLTVNVNQLTQTATGQLLSTAGLDGRGINWTNDGQIGTDGSATLDLSGSYGGKGRLSSTGALDLHAALINLEAAGSIAGGGSSTVTVDGLLNNYGRVTSAADMTVNAAGISNYGTLGGAQKLTVTTAELINDHGLIFSGADMGLRVDSLNNLGASVYSLGNLSIDRDGQGALASSIVNSSGSIQSDGSMSLAASTIQNVRTVLTTNNQGIYTASIGEIQCIEGYNAGDCSGKRNHVWQIIQRDKFEVTQASAASSITAGTNLAIRGGDLLNSSSTIAAGGALSATVTNLVNSGIETGETETSRTFMSERTKNAGGLYASAASFNNYYSVQGAGYNPNNLGGLLGAMSGFIGLTEIELGQFRTTRKIAASDQTYAAVIQAGGAVSVNTQNGITSSVVRPSYTYVGAGPRTDNLAPANTFSTRITINQQLPPDLAHQQVNPVSLPGFSLPVGENGLFRLSGQTSTSHQSSVHVPGLPDTSVRSNPQKYLIETNPALTDLKQFMSSDYLLSKLGYNPDESAKRLGDGFYEQKLIQQAVTARTGQRFIDGQTSDDGMFKFLMNNAVASKDALNLQLGVSLTSEQVAALTHDIVWMENATVNGEQVLVPVLYMANANNRLAANGALIQGSDVTLIAGKELNNAGTLRASNNLSTTAGSDLVNSGLLEANNRLTALAGNNLTNKAGGIIAGRDVSITATGDVINERTITTHESSTGYKSEQRGFADNAARIEASNNLEISAGRDISNRGGVLKSAQDTTLKASRDVNITSAEQVDSNTRGDSHNDRTVTQNGSSVTAGRDLVIGAGRDLTAVASQIEAKRDATLSAVNDMTLSSAADEQHSYGKTKKVTSQEDHTQQVATRVFAGGNVVLTAGNDLGLTASNVSAGNEAYLSAGANLTLQTAANEDYSFYSKVKKSSSGKKSRLDEVASTTNMASSVTSGTNSTLVAGKDLLIKGSEVAADKGAAKLVAGNDVQVVAVTDSNSARHESSKSKSSWGGLKSSKVQDAVAETQTVARGSIISGNTVDVAALHDVMVRGSGLVSTQDLNVRAGRDLVIDAVQNTFTHDEMHKQKNRDLTGVLTANNLGVDDITGNQHLSISSQNHTGRSTQTTLTGSTIGSSQGNVALTAGRELSVIASDLVSTKNMSLTGANVNIAAGMESASQSSTDKSSSLAVGRVVGGAVVDTFNSIRGAIQAANNADDPKLKAVKMAQAALAAYNLNGMGDSVSGSIKDYANNKGSSSSNGSLIKIGTETALTHSKSTSDYASQTAKQSSLNVGQALSIEATGKAPSTLGDIHVIGSSLKAADTALTAKNNIILESAQNTAGWANNNSNNRTAIGASFNIGQQNGFTIDLGAQIAKGMGTGSSVTQVNTTLDSGVLTLHSGKDTTLDGAQVRATKIDALVEGNLNITSRQDSETEKNKQGSAGVGASICIPPICYGAPVTASATLSASNMKSNYQAVTDQSGLFAGNGGYNIVVGANTTLQGAVIASEATADKNLLSTDRLITSDIKNKSEIKSTSASVSGSASYGGSGGSAAALGGLFGMSLSESDSSKTRSAVSEGTIIVRNAEGANDLVGLNRDTANANEKLERPDKKAMEERMELVRSSVELANGISDAIATARMKAAQDPKSDESKAARQQLLEKGNANPTADQIAQQVSQNYGVGSSFKKAAQAVSAVIQGVLGGNIGGALAGAAAPYVAERIKMATGDDDAANLMAHAVWGAVLAKAQGSSALAGAAGAGIGEYIAKQLYPNKPVDQLTESEKQTISALSTLAGGLAGGLAAGGLNNAIAAAGAAKNAVENNHLDSIEYASLEIKREKYNASCIGVSSTECTQLKADIEALFKKAQSILKEETISLASDATWDSSLDHKPGDIVMCKTSYTSFCVVTDKSVKTANGNEWYLKPATVEQALEGRANQEKMNSDMEASLKKVATDSFHEGCGGGLGVAIVCQLSMALGATNPVTEAKATTGERIGYFAQALLNIVGLKGAVGGVAAKGGVGVPLTRAENPLSPVLEFDAFGNEIVYRTMSSEQYKLFKVTGVMPATGETSISPSLAYSSGYEGVTVRITTAPGTSAALQKIGIAANEPAAAQFSDMSMRPGSWVQENARFKVEGGQMTTQLGGGKALDIFNGNIVKFEVVP